VLEYFGAHLFSGTGQQTVQQELGVSAAQAEALMRRHLGVCLDTCHASVEFEQPLEVYHLLLAHGICVPKVQISAGLRLDASELSNVRALRAFDEPVYFHQVVARENEVLNRYVDLPLAFAAHAHQQLSNPAGASEWRVHFHVPLFTDQYGLFASTRADIVPLLQALATASAPCPHLEVETYTWNVLPDVHRDRSLPDAIAAELQWVAEVCALAQQQGSP
jgi:hypothetical protein